ncbi:muscle, skeletal receptor tyrosine-protein kinase-like isoform X2 [Cylas formicarius]|uniref:muscle, skeletal receptor tyrosine-protein kinase-like isoform X2 n=1 Tax=Cylas formicarius TaxID=197179 RepID=UPI0029583F65|nr:muscle, skeletal receptor tyrosine-protein kinase-like isoform X2 [Cylas formicarius]
MEMVWRGSRKRAAEKMSSEDERITIYHEGPCVPGVCRGETACKYYVNNNTYTCLCTHDSRPPTKNGTCPRRIVNEQPGRIPNVQPPSIKVDESLAATQRSTFSNFMVPSLLLAAGSIALFVCILIYIKTRMHRRTEATSPINLKHSLLIAERYTPNPQYSACSGAGIPVLRKETLKFLNELGEGCFGKVYKGELISDDGSNCDIVAIKVLKDSASKENEEDFFREVEIMSAFRHPNILSLLGVVLREGAVGPMMVFEYMKHGDLAEVLRVQRRLSTGCYGEDYTEHPPLLYPSDLLNIALQVAKGMEYLAAQRFVHRDLACRNCLVAEGSTVKIADFGMSRDVYTCDYYKMGGSRLLPVRWMSPESVVYGRFTLESDIWSYGVVLWEIFSYGKQPYYGHSNDEVVKLILDGIMLIPPDDCPSVICNIMKNCWKTEPKHRIHFSNIKTELEAAYDDKNLKYKVARTNMNFLMSNEYMRMWFKEKEIYERNTYSTEQIIKDESKIKRRYVQRMMTYKKPTKNDFNKEMKDRPKYNNPMKVDYSKYKCKPECPKLKIDGNIEAHSSKVLVRENEINDAICKIKILPCDCHNTEKYK